MGWGANMELELDIAAPAAGILSLVVPSTTGVVEEACGVSRLFGDLDWSCLT